MFCFCGAREEQSENNNSKSELLVATNLQPSMKAKSIVINNNGELSSDMEYSDYNQNMGTSDSYNQITEYQNFINEFHTNCSRKQEVYLLADSDDCYFKQEEAKTSHDLSRLIHQGDGLLAKIVSINQATAILCEDTFSVFIMKVLNQTKRHYQISPQQEVQFVKQLVPHIITEQTMRRVKNDRLLIAHDPTGSFLMKHLISHQMVFYIQESKTYRNILNSALSILNCEEKINYIVKSEITEKLDTAVINLLNMHDTPISPIIQEYLTLAHDIIIIISPKLEYHELMSQLRHGIKTSSQSNIHCSIEMQNIYNQNQLIARIVYFGEVSNITQNQQLNFLYDCIPKTAQKTLKYKSFFKDLRSLIGIMKLVDLFALYGLIQNNSEQTFERFYQQVLTQYFPNVKSSRFIPTNTQSNESSTESESEDPVPLLKVNSSILQEPKIYSKSLSTNQVKQEYVHFLSQNINYTKTRFNHHEKMDRQEQHILN